MGEKEPDSSWKGICPGLAWETDVDAGKQLSDPTRDQKVCVHLPTWMAEKEPREDAV